MYASNIFDACYMRDWGRKSNGDETWVHLEAYFGQLYTDAKQYEKATGNKPGFESAANVQELLPPLLDSPDKL